MNPNIGLPGARERHCSDVENLSDLRRDVARFARTSDMRGYLCLGVNWIVIIGCWVLWSFVAVRVPLSVRIGLWIVELIVLTSRIRALESLTHEASHNTLFHTRRLNVLLQGLYALPVLHEVRAYRKEHSVHHARLGRPDDPAQILFARHLVSCFPHRSLWVMLGRPLFGYHTRDWLGEKLDSWVTLPSFRLIGLFWGAVLIAAFFAGQLSWLILHWLFALALLFPIVEFWGEVADHAALDANALAATRSNIGVMHRLLLHTHADGYHMVHHINPAIPGNMLATAHAFLRRTTSGKIVESHSIIQTLSQLSARSGGRITRNYPWRGQHEATGSLCPEHVRCNLRSARARKRLGSAHEQRDTSRSLGAR